MRRDQVHNVKRKGVLLPCRPLGCPKKQNISPPRHPPLRKSIHSKKHRGKREKTGSGSPDVKITKEVQRGGGGGTEDRGTVDNALVNGTQDWKKQGPKIGINRILTRGVVRKGSDKKNLV